MQRFWGFLFGGVMVAALGSFFLAAIVPGWWLPRDVSTFGADIDNLFYVILYLTGFFFVLTESVLVYCLFKFAYKPGRKSAYSHGNHRLEVVWTVIPGIILIVLAIVQISAWAKVKFLKNMPRPDGETLQVEVIAKQWEWRMRYPSAARMESWAKDPALALDFGGNPHEDDIKLTNEVHTWKDAKALVHLKTMDVLHSFFLPNLRLKQDALPGRAIPVWFAAKESNTVKTGTTEKPRWLEEGYDPVTGSTTNPEKIWELTCAEFCGARHSLMRGKLYVHASKADYMEWLRNAEREQRRTQLADVAAPTVKTDSKASE